MKQFLRRISPKRALVDLWQVWTAPEQSHRWPVLGVSIALTFAMFMLFIPESQRIEPRPPEVTWISTFSEDRTEQQIIASNCRNQQLKDALQARLDQRAEIRRDLWMALGRATFIDVDAIEAEAEATRATAEQSGNAPIRSDSPLAALTVEEYCARALDAALG
ncbi:hypothetical protein [Alteraurantiacibacter aquimixticola]|uniref:Uncharacterized protein n=1 Tax=Alteraurantiacibacter aquimixticola TaxID=2489173 RepID=A0A4T3EYC5_9SPHN|nr:hypothetical protein [Alteraurantiacibacter aquimixticola]TIX49649.1 hypothetical protein E5222_12550 [Alteraurantiacibacter aquimixticola]